MTIRSAVAGRNAALDAEIDRVDAGPGPGVLKVYTGAQPANGDAAESGTLLVEFTLADPAFDPSTGGVKTLAADPDIDAVAANAGTAGWMRCEDSTGANIFDGSVGATGSGADFTINTTAITAGQSVTLLAGTITYPA